MKKLRISILPFIIVISLLGVLNIKIASEPNAKTLKIRDLKQSAIAGSELYTKVNEPCSSSDPVHIFKYGCYYWRYQVCYEQYCLEEGGEICIDTECGWACKWEEDLDYCLAK